MFTINLGDGREAPSKARKKGAKRLEFLVNYKKIQGYSQMMRLQRQLFWILTVCFFIFKIPWNCKLVAFTKSFIYLTIIYMKT